MSFSSKTLDSQPYVTLIFPACNESKRVTGAVGDAIRYLEGRMRGMRDTVICHCPPDVNPAVDETMAKRRSAL